MDAGRVVKGLGLKNWKMPEIQFWLQAYEEQGADELVFLDITASSDERETMREVVERAVATCFMPVTVGGGIRTLEDIRSMLLCGADKVGLNTAAILNPDLINRRLPGLATNALSSPLTEAKEEVMAGSFIRMEMHKPTELDAIGWAQEVVSRGAGEILLTSMDRDGTKEGFDLPLTRAISDAVEVPVIASGGVENQTTSAMEFSKAVQRSSCG